MHCSKLKAVCTVSARNINPHDIWNELRLQVETVELHFKNGVCGLVDSWIEHQICNPVFDLRQFCCKVVIWEIRIKCYNLVLAKEMLSG